MKKFIYNLAADKYKGVWPGLIKAVLFILSLIYGLLVRLLMAVCEKKQYHPPCKVISVGNITLGGTGKTPLVEYIAKYLKANGRKIAVITRGYKKKVKSQKSPPEAGPPTAEKVKSYETMGDEPYMLQKILKDIPVIVDINRIRAIKFAVSNYGADTVILDDGFQQWKIRKNLEIVVIDAGNPFGNKQMLPRGILRQPPSSLKKADVFVLTKTDINPEIENIINFLKGINPNALIVEAMHKPIGFYEIPHPNPLPAEERGKGEGIFLDTHIFTGQAIALVSGIGDPDSFEKLVESLGMIFREHFKFQDHHDYSTRDLNKIAQDCREKGIETVVTTEKDAVKLCQLSTINYQLSIFVLSIELKIAKYEREFSDRLSGLYSL